MPPNSRNGAARRLLLERRAEFPKEIFRSSCTRIAHDLEVNLRHLLEKGSLPSHEAFLVLLTASIALEFEPLVNFAVSELRSMSVNEQEIQDAREIATLMTLTNSYYIFRNASRKAEYTRSIGLDLNPYFRSLSGTRRYEMLAVAASIANHSAHGIIIHRVAAEERGVTSNQIEDLARLVSIVRAIRTLSFDAKCQDQSQQQSMK
jgi:AhpD family alkylhydroperoxidase